MREPDALVDSSVWIDFYRGFATDQTRLLRQMLRQRRVLVGDLVLCEVLMGVGTEHEARVVEAELRKLDLVEISSVAIATQAARNYRELRRLGFTVRKMADLLIGTFCIAHGHLLLHRDRDFDAMEAHLGLRVVRA